MRLVGEFNRTFRSSSELGAEEMFQMDEQTDIGVALLSPSAIPGEVGMILSAMEAARPASIDRRGTQRTNYRTVAQLRLFSDSPLSPPTELYTRDVHARGIGFITKERLPLGYGGIVELQLPNGRNVRAHCTIFRCRESISGWFEGALHFTRHQNCDN